VYVDVAGAGGLPEEDVTAELSRGGRRLDLRVARRDAGEVHVLTLQPLNDEASGVSVRRKAGSDAVTVTLTKAVELTWFDLLKRGAFDYPDEFN
jgi:hypothetical protein